MSVLIDGIEPETTTMPDGSRIPAVYGFIRWHLSHHGLDSTLGSELAERAKNVVFDSVDLHRWPAGHGNVNGAFILQAYNETFCLDLKKVEKVSRSEWCRENGADPHGDALDRHFRGLLKSDLRSDVREAFGVRNLMCGKYCICDHSYCRDRTLEESVLEIIGDSVLPPDSDGTAHANRRAIIAHYIQLLAAGNLNPAEKLEPLVRSFRYGGLIGRRRGFRDDTLLIEVA